MGEIFRADDLKLRQPVALKFLPPDLTADPSRLARLQDEVRVARQVCSGLAAAHAAGVLHRDLKPANVMLDSAGHARITDSGLAVALASSRDDGEVAGTPAYMAPEQIAGQPASAQTDLWSFGVLLFEILTGKRPFAGPSLAELAREQRRSPPPSPSSVVSGIGPGVDAIVERCLAPDSSHRPRNAMEVLTALTGGDALGAAVAAGQTPSPDSVAAAGSEGALRPTIAWACFIGTLVCIVPAIFLASRAGVVEHAALERPPEVLAARAQEIVEQFGLGEPNAVSTCGFGHDGGAMAFLAAHARSRGVAPFPIVFWCRRGSERPVGRTALNEASDREPPPVPGEVLVVLDPTGRLLRLVAVPGSGWTAGAAEAEGTWAALFRFAGIDRAQFVPDAPEHVPPVYADARSGWRGGPGAFADLRVEAALLGNRPVYFEVLGPWHVEKPSGGLALSATRGFAGGAGSGAVLLSMLGVAALLAWRNLQRGRGDLRDTRRVAAVIMALYLVRLGRVRSSRPRAGEVDMLALGLSRALFIAFFVSTLYLALEPYVRQRWPQSLVSWSRLLAGRVTDPMVARDVLIAQVALWGLTMAGVAILIPSLGGRLVPLHHDLLALMGMRQVIGSVAGAATGAIQSGMLFLLLLLLTHSIRRRRASGLLFVAAAGTLMLSWWAAEAGSSLGASVVVIAFVAMYFFLLTRLGLLAAVVAMYASWLSLLLPDAFYSFSSWYAFSTWTFVGVNVALAGYGLWFSVGKERLFGWASLDR